MFDALPRTIDAVRGWTWDDYRPYYADLEARPLTAASAAAWLADWSRLSDLISETRWRMYVATTQNTADEEAARRYQSFFDDLNPPVQSASQRLKEKLLASGLEPEGFAVPLRNMRAEAALFREDNLPLLAEEQKHGLAYESIFGAQTVEWEGAEVTIIQLNPVLLDPDRARREAAWRLTSERILADREAISQNWARLVGIRHEIARNAGLPDFRAYRWRHMKRFDYTPQDAAAFHDAIEEVFVPAAARVYERKRARLGVESLRPWDTKVDPLGRPPLRPYQTAAELTERGAAIFHRVDPQVGACFDTMREEGLLDLENRKGKAPGGYCVSLEASRRALIFMNGVGLHDDVMTLVHEMGHALHNFELLAHLPYSQQYSMDALTEEMTEVGSMAMELLAAPYLLASEGGFYGPDDYARARVEHLEDILTFLPYMAVVDGFQHWAYTHADEAVDAGRCDAAWSQLWDRFMVGIDYSGLDEVKATGWQRKVHIHTDPFYYIEYGLAQIGAVQVWRNALADQADAVRRYRRALALGATVTIPEFYTAAGARFAFDAAALREAVTLIEQTIETLDAG